MHPADYFWEQAEVLAAGVATTRREPDGGSELFIPTRGGTLEITKSGKFVSMASGGLFIEDRPVETQQDADFLLAVCDAVLNERVSVKGPSATAELTTRGYTTVWKSA